MVSPNYGGRTGAMRSTPLCHSASLLRNGKDDRRRLRAREGVAQMALASRWLRSGHTCFLNQVIDGLLTKPQKSPEARCQVLFFLPSAHRFVIASDSLSRPAEVIPPPRFFWTRIVY